MSQKSQELRVRVDPARVEHFIDIITSQQIIQDLPFGRRKLKLSNGEILDVPNVIRLLIPTRLVNQYFQYCQETGFTNPLPRSTLMKILSESCSASVRRCMQGLDNYLAEGARAFDEFSSIVDKLSEIGLEKDVADRLKESLKSGKQYLKGDYKLLSTRQLYLIFNNYFVFKIQWNVFIILITLQFFNNFSRSVVFIPLQYSRFMLLSSLRFLIIAEYSL